MKEISTIGIDLAKSRFRVVGHSSTGKVLLKKWLQRDEVISFFVNLKPCLIGMEACSGSHYFGRELTKVGHTVKLMPPQYVKPYVKTNKNDTNDADACAEAVSRETMRFVPIKSERQQQLIQLHRVRERLVGCRTALGNEIRGFLCEFGIVVSPGMDKLSSYVREALLNNSERLLGDTVKMIERLLGELTRVSEEIKHYEEQISLSHAASPESQRLDTIPGVGELTATAIVAMFSDVEQFKSGRQFAAFLGLVPKQHSTGGKSRLGKISKRGDTYIRNLLIQGSQSVLQHALKKTDAYSSWIRKLHARRGWCRTVVAIANKNARIAWAILARGVKFEAEYVPQRG